MMASQIVLGVLTGLGAVIVGLGIIVGLFILGRWIWEWLRWRLGES